MLAFELIHICDQAFYSSELFEEFDRSFLAYSGDTGDIIHCIPHQSEDISDLIHMLDIPLGADLLRAHDIDSIAHEGGFVEKNMVIDDLPSARWHIGGAPAVQPTALLEISITQGTNTQEEKAAFIQAAFAELQRQLAGDGTLAAASYVVVRELPASDWGYGGRTQQARKLALAA